MRSEGYCSLRIYVCVRYSSSRVFVRLKKDTTYLTGNEGQNFERFPLKQLR